MIRKLVLALLCLFLYGLSLPAQRIDSLELAGPLPDPLLCSDGSPIATQQEWSACREQVLESFRTQVYGKLDAEDIRVSYRLVYLNRDALRGRAVHKEIDVVLSGDGRQHSFRIMLLLPPDQEAPVPVFLGLNFYGNQSICDDPSVSLTKGWCHNDAEMGIRDNRATIASRGVRVHRWPVEMILERGYGLAAVHYGEIDPDFDDGFRNGLHGLMGKEDREADDGGAIAAWAWALSRVLDYLETDSEVDASRVAVIGHSRLGKTALWAGAQDERFALVISNNSGCGGAALSRREHGERVSVINKAFPHWFAENFRTYGDREEALPVDQHQLLALIAPRPLYIASAEEDDWADPYGEYLSLYHAGKVYALYGHAGLPSMARPAVDQPLWKGPMAYHLRSGKHDLTTYDWAQYLAFADLHLKGPGKAVEEDENPVSQEWLQGRLRKRGSRLMFTRENEAELKRQIKEGDPLVAPVYALLKQRADALLSRPPLKREMEGIRLLGVSREAISRLTGLAMVYRVERKAAYLTRLEKELNAVCRFSDWNPPHFLDVAEMATGVALALDWAGEWMSADVYRQSMDALVRLALKPGVASSKNNWWLKVDHNWNLVCNSGLSLAALLAFDEEPEICSRILHQAVEAIPNALKPYGPDGVYPEGASYWFYATTYLALGISAFETALNTDFQFLDRPGVSESAFFSEMLAGPSGDYFNFFDARVDRYHSIEHCGLLAWFAKRGVGALEPDSFARMPADQRLADPLSGDPRFLAFFLLNLSMLPEKGEFSLPDAWVGGGAEPLAVFREKDGDDDGFFLAAKGGSASDNHGNMDAGSFILELDSLRWVVDPGNQNYHGLEQVIGNELWNTSQGSVRWTLLTKGSHGHSTLQVNGEPHRVKGRSRLLGFDLRGPAPVVHFTLDEVLAPHLRQATRSFSRLSDRELLVRDRFSFSATAESLQWQLMTTAEVEVEEEGLVLKMEGKELLITPLLALPFRVEVEALSPPPLPYDKDIPGLKRVVFHFRRADFPGSEGEIVVSIKGRG